MDRRAALTAFDEQMRRRPVAGPGMRIEVDERVTRAVGTDFASLWGGGTIPAWRGRGVFRALVGHRALLACDPGVRYLQIDALPASRPILERMGFHPLAETTPWIYDRAASLSG